MQITFHGAVRSVTGSRHLLEVQGHKILLDCGLYQGRRFESETRNREFPFDPGAIEAVLLSHAHIDHSGNLPNLVKQGFRGPIHATRATAGLLDPMLMDSGHIQERDVEFLNKRLARKKQKPVAPLYTQADVEKTLPLIESQAYGRQFEVVPGISVHFRDAGHILGSAITVLDLQEGGKQLRLVYTGDLGRKHLPIIRDPETVPGVEVLICETTYGNRLHDETQQVPDIMTKLLNRAHERRSKVIIPSFAVGRTQEIVTVLKDLFRSRRVPAMPVYVDSPLAVNVTDVFREHEECFDEETLHLLRDEHTDPFGFRLMHYVRDVEESKSLNAKSGPMIIISASGMCEAGRIRHHLLNSIGNPANLILFVGFQAEHTLGRRLVEGRKEVNIFGEPVEVHAEVRVIDAFSAHADRDELLGWIKELDRRPRRIYLVHGEEKQSLSFGELLQENGFRNAVVPELGQTYLL